MLEQVRRTKDVAEVGRVQLWPEHFDLGFEMGIGAQRANYGASPGDDRHSEPYLYVGPWEAGDSPNSFWNDRAFNGAAAFRIGYCSSQTTKTSLPAISMNTPTAYWVSRWWRESTV